MNFDQRANVVKEMLVEFLEMLSAPKGLDDAAKVKLIESIAGSLARKMPVTAEDKYREGLVKVFDAVLDDHPSHSWPPQGLFAKHVPKGISGSTAPATFAPNERDMAAKKMQAGEAVPEDWVWGRRSQQLLNSGEVSQALMAKYREGSARTFIEAYRGAAAQFAEQKYGPIVREYFGKEGA